MANQAQVNSAGGQVSWSITIGDLKVAVYRALLLNSGNTVVERWDDQRTSDNVPDDFTLTTAPAALTGAVLWWQALVMDPSNSGGAYVGTVTITQDGKTLATVTAQGAVPAGAGKMDSFADEITFAVVSA